MAKKKKKEEWKSTRQTPEAVKFARSIPTFLEMLREVPYVKLVAQKLDMKLSTVYYRRRIDEKFRKAWDLAIEEGVDATAGEAYRRGVMGIKRFVVSSGRVVMVKNRAGEMVPLEELEYSDTLLVKLLQAHHPKFKEQRVLSHVGKDGGPIQTLDVQTLIAQKEAELIALGGDPIAVKRALIESLSASIGTASPDGGGGAPAKA